MSANIIDGSAIAKAIRAEIATEVTAMVAEGLGAPHLAVVLCGDDPASATYVRNKSRAAERAGIRFTLQTPDGGASTAEILDLCARLRDDPDIDGMLVQLPLPRQIDAGAVLEAVPAAKDADGFHPLNLGRLAAGGVPPVLPGTPLGCMELLRRSGVPIAGSRAVVVGRSVIVGRPLALLLVNADATVTVCHSKSRDLLGITRQADILISAVGRRPQFSVTREMVREGAVVIDVAMNRIAGKLIGDVDFEGVSPRASYITPVPGGVGPMTVIMLMENTLVAAAKQHGLKEASVPIL